LQAVDLLLLLLAPARARLALLGFDAFLLPARRGGEAFQRGPVSLDVRAPRERAPPGVGQPRPRRSGGGFIKVILIVTRIMRQLAGADAHDMVGQRANEIDIVTDEDERAFVLV